MIDNQSMVDYLNINSLYLLSYPVPQGGGGIDPSLVPDLNITHFKQINFSTGDAEAQTDERQVMITITERGYKINGLVNDTDINTTGTFGNITQVNGNNLSFEITIGNPGEGQVYNPGDEYVISLQPMNRDLIPVNFNIPIFRSNTITLEINEVV